MKQPPVAFLFPAFPVLHQTFVLWEVLALRRRGIALEIYSIKRPSTKSQQPEGEALQREVHYLPPTLSLAVLAANLRALRRSPGRYLASWARVTREWWRDRRAGRAWQSRRASEEAPERMFTPGEYLRGRFNRSPFLYLLKSLWLIPRAAYLSERLAQSGAVRVHAHWASYSATMALVAHWLCDVPFSFSAHAYDIYLVPRLLGVKVREADFAVTCAKVNAAFLVERAGAAAAKRIVVNYHGVSLDRFRPMAPRRAATPPCIVTCGRLEPYKGHHVLLRACARLSVPVRCVLVGEGPQRRRLERLAAELGIAERVEFTGAVAQARLVEIYAAADVFVLASVVLERSGKRDVIPNVLAEAMAMKLPVVATDVSGIAELVDDGVGGRLVRPNDPAALAAVLEELLHDEDERRRLAEGGYEKVRRAFDRETNIEALAALFRGGSVGSAPAAGAPRAVEVR
jgi:glycosyltransferase involved in cell wall biosynthesis